MRKIVLTIAVVLSMTALSYAQDVQRRIQIFQKKNKYGISVDGKITVKADYEAIKYLSQGNFSAKKEGRWGVIDNQGKVRIPFSYDDLKLYTRDLFLVKNNGAWGIIDSNNKEVLPTDYVSFRFTDDTNELCEVKSRAGKMGLINKYGEPIVRADYDKVEPFINKTFLVYEGNKCGIIDNRGKLLIAARYDGFEKNPHNANQYLVRMGNRIGIMDVYGKMILEPLYDSIEPSPLGLKLIQNGLIGFYTDSEQLISPKYPQIVFIQSELGLAVVKSQGKYALVTVSGVDTGAVYENISRFSDRGIAFVERNGKLMVLNAQGREMLVQEVMQSQNKPFE